MTTRRPSLLSQVRLSDGRLAWPVAQSSGVSEATFRKRLKAGLSPDEAATRPVPVRDLERIAARRQERCDYQARRAADADMRRKAAKRPARLDVLADAYAGVIWQGGDCRLIASPRGAFYALQVVGPGGDWQIDKEFPSASLLRHWLLMVAIDPAPALLKAAAGLPDKPALSGFAPFCRSAC